MGIRVQPSDLTTPILDPPPKETQWHPIHFRAKGKNGKLQITVISCKDLPDADLAGIGFGNKSDPYVTVRVGSDGKKQQTKAISGKLDPVFKKETSVFEFDVSPTAKTIFFEVMDKDTFTPDDLIGKAQIKLTQGQANGILLSLALKVKEEDDSSDDE